MKIVGIREHQVELEGDFSGGTHHTVGKAWFPKEGLLFEPKGETSPALTKDDVSESKNQLYESDDVIMEACLLVREDGSLAYDNIYINLTDKTPKKRKDWKEHFLDNPTWLFGILDSNEESIESALEFINHNQLTQLKAFIIYLYKIEWLRKPIENKIDYPKYLKRPSDNQVFILDDKTLCYQSYPKLGLKPYPHFTYDILTQNHGFTPCDVTGKSSFPLSTEVRDNY
jgi:hypothetical protein